MTPIIETNQQDTILTKDITEKHIVVAVGKGYPRILSKDYSQHFSELTFLNIADEFVTGNGVSGVGSSIKEKVEWCIKDGYNVAVFKQQDWKQALQWLIDNA